MCSEFNPEYEIYFTGYESVDARNCVDETCSVVFTEFSANVREYFLTIMATNHSHNISFSTKIGENEYCARSGCIEYLPCTYYVALFIKLKSSIVLTKNLCLSHSL